MEFVGLVETLTSLDPVSVGLKLLLVVFCIIVWVVMRRWTEYD